MAPSLLSSLRSLNSVPSDAKALHPGMLREPEPQLFAPAQHSRIALKSAFTHLQTYAGDDAIDWVYDCVTLIAEAVAGADYHFEAGGDRLVTNLTEDEPDAEQAPSDLVRLLERPNPYASWKDLVMLLVIDYLLIGNAFWYRFKPDDERKPRALYRLMPHYLSIIPGRNRLIDGYEYKVPGAEPVKFDADSIIHFRRPNPHSEFLGAGVIKGGARIFDMELALTRTQTEYFEQGTRLSGVLESDRGVPNNVWKKIKGQFAALYAGAANSYKVAMLTHGMKFKPIQGTAAEAEFRFLTGVSRDRILAMFRVPPPLLGVTGGFDRQAVKEAQRIFDNKTVRPLADNLQEVISLALTAAWDVDFKIDYEYVMPVEDQLALAVDVATLPGIRVHEVRKAAGYDPLGPDEIGPDGKPIDDTILNLPGSDENASDVKDRNLGDEAGRPPDPENTRAFPRAGQRTPRDAQVARAEKAFVMATETLDRAMHRLEEIEHAPA